MLAHKRCPRIHPWTLAALASTPLAQYLAVAPPPFTFPPQTTLIGWSGRLGGEGGEGGGGGLCHRWEEGELWIQAGRAE